MSCFGKRVNIPGGRRKGARRPVAAIGSAVSVGGSRSILVEDIGIHGVKVRGRGLPGIGEQVLTGRMNSMPWDRSSGRALASAELHSMPPTAPHLRNEGNRCLPSA
jgi:hypothetical protein